MPAIKIKKFLGTSPKVSPELTAEAVAQEAVNVKLYSGDLIPYKLPSVAATLKRSGEIKTIYPMDDGDGTYSWLSWLTDVDVAVATSLNDEEQRIYYTGDGAPKVTNYELAVGSSSGPYPQTHYDLGLPIPSAVPSAAESVFSAKTIDSVARDSSGLITYTTTSNHELRSGNVVTVSGFDYYAATYSRSGTTVTVTLADHGFTTGDQLAINVTSGSGTDGVYTITVASSSTFTYADPTSGSTSGDCRISATSYNISNAVCTVVDDTTFTVFSPGFQQTTYSLSSTPKLNLAGTTLSRAYVYTWVTPWLEESVPSEPSDLIYTKEGQTVTVSNLPTAGPGGNNQISGIRLYRTVTGNTGTSYLRLKTIWFPRTATFASRTSNVVTLTVSEPHNLAVDDLIKVDGIAFGGVPDTSFDVVDETVISVVDDYTFTYAATGSDKAETATTDGTLFWDIAEIGSGTSRFYEGSTFVDDYSVSSLSVGLDTLDADAPDDNMTGLRVAQNNIMVGFVGNELCFSEPNRPWSWPIRYRLVFEHEIVAVEPASGSILVLTEKYPYIVSGSVPANMSASRVDVVMPCISKRGVVNMGYGVVFPSHGGLALFSPQGADIITKLVHDWDTWTTASFDPTTLRSSFYEGKYLGAHDNGAIIFERDDNVGGLLVTTPTKMYATYYDTLDSTLYYVSDLNGALSVWDAPGQPFMSMSWKSKVFVAADYTSVGAVRVVADYGGVEEDLLAIQTYNAGVPTTNAAWWTLMAQLGTLNGPVDYTDPDTTDYVPVFGTFNSMLLNGDPVTVYQLSVDDLSLLGFRLWANKSLKVDVETTSSDIFRIPAGYKSDTFEVAVSGKLRVRAIHFGETPYGLRAV